MTTKNLAEEFDQIYKKFRKSVLNSLPTIAFLANEKLYFKFGINHSGKITCEGKNVLSMDDKNELQTDLLKTELFQFLDKNSLFKIVVTIFPHLNEVVIETITFNNRLNKKMHIVFK